MKRQLMTLTELRVSSFVTTLAYAPKIVGGVGPTNHEGARCRDTWYCDTPSNSGSSLNDPNGCPQLDTEDNKC